MSSPAQKYFSAARVPGFTGRGDKYLGEIAQELRKVLWKIQKSFTYTSCCLPDPAWMEISVLLVDWAEDIHNDIGLWRTVEEHQRQCFGTPLPFIVDVAPEVQLNAFDPRRIQFFLWNMWPCFNAERLLSPTHPDLQLLAQAASQLLTARFSVLPMDSGVKRFLATSNKYGWNVKRKLLWLGINSYLFRFLFFKYLDDHNREPDIPAKDDFVCQQCTEWSGLGVIDVLAGVLDVTAEDRATLRTWYERHTSLFRVLTRQDSGDELKVITARNLVNGQLYSIRMEVVNCPFVPGMVISGSLTPWRGEWYWSGMQESFNDISELAEPEIRQNMLANSSAIAYRYCPAEADQAFNMARHRHERFVAHYGNDFVVFPDGLTLAAAEQKRMAEEWQSADQDKVAILMQERGLKNPRPNMDFPPDFLNHDQGIGAFSHPDQGMEFFIGFNILLSGLRKHGVELTENEMDVFGHFLTDRSVSPAFIRRVLAEHGAESLLAIYLMRRSPPELALEFLLRRHKGQYYRKHYPSITIVPEMVKAVAS